MTDAAPGTSEADREVTGPAGVLSFTVPVRMTAIVDDAEDRLPLEVLAVINVKDGFAPSLAVTVHGYEGDQSALTWSVLDGLRRDLRQPRIIGVSRWTAPDQWGATEQGRQVDYLHRAADGQLVAGREYVAVARGWAVQVSTSASVQTRLVFDEMLQQAVGNLSVLREAGRMDPVTTVVGAPASGACEDLTWLVDQAAWTYPEAVGLLPGSLEVLQLADPDSPVLPRVPEVLDDLAGAGLLGNDGWTEDGVFLADVLRAARSSLTATLFVDGQETTLSCVISGEVSAAVWGPGRGQRQLGHPGEATDRRLGVALVPTIELSAVVCGWLGVTPAWTLDEAPLVSTAQQLEALVEGQDVPGLVAPGTPVHLWRLTTTTEAGVIDEVDYLGVAGRGLYTVRGDEEFPDTVVLWPAEPAWVLRLVEDRVQAAYFGRPVTLD